MALWEDLLKWDINWARSRVRWGNPEITDNVVATIEREWFEWQTPPKWDRNLFPYRWKYYKINRDWMVKGLDWKVMKPFFNRNKRWPRIRVKKQTWSETYDWEIWIISMMERKYWPYFPWYSLKKKNPKWYILVPIDWNYNNMKYNNLHYVKKTEYKSTKKMRIKNLLSFHPNIPDKDLVMTFHTSLQYLQKIKSEMLKSGMLDDFKRYQDLQKILWIEFSQDMMPIYESLWQSKWSLSNMEIVKLVRWDKIEWSIQKEREVRTDKVVRVRKKMTEKRLIPRFNSNFEEKRKEAVDMINKKEITWYTHQQIADILWLNKQQIDNLARQIKKDKKKDK